MNPNLGFGILTGIVAAAILAIAFRAWRYHTRDLRALMDQGDGQGGVPPLPAFTVHPQLEQIPEDCDWCTPAVPVTVAMPDDCKCTRDCRIGYCQRRPELQDPWPDRGAAENAL